MPTLLPRVESKCGTVDGQVPHAFCTDDELIQAAKLGNHEAFAELCRRHAQTARQKIFRIVRHREDAEDALQETLLRAYMNIAEFRQASTFSTWITAIGTNAALNLLRKKKSRREFDIEPMGPGERILDIADQAPNPEHRVAKRQLLLFLQAELEALPPQMREAVTNYYDENYSLREAATELGLSVAGANSRLVRGRKRLRSSFERKRLLGSSLW
jgi:RNA polymerase sigma-70 factor, ECF subfamily